MTQTYIALLRAVNVGGTGKLPMVELKAICVRLGFENVRTYIASGNVVFESGLPLVKIRAELESRLADYAGKPMGVHIRTDVELKAVLAANPFPQAPGNRCVVIFLDAEPPVDALSKISGQADEKLGMGAREIYVWYGEGMAHSKLKISAAKEGTARNMNTVKKLVELAK
jgi:uncharacterized protein (DUF1697 family)